MDVSKLVVSKSLRLKAGDYRLELVFILEQELQLYEFYQAQIMAVDTQIEQCLASFVDKVDVSVAAFS